MLTIYHGPRGPLMDWKTYGDASGIGLGVGFGRVLGEGVQGTAM